jgi:putative spermidine/putrescine transport system permease protein
MPETTSQEEASKAFRYPLRWRVMDALNAGLDRFWPASMTPYTGLALITPALLLVGLLVLGLFQMADSSLHTLDRATFLPSENYTLENYQTVFENATYGRIIWRSVLAAVLTVFFTLLLALPYSYIMVRTSSSTVRKALLVVLFLPFFIGQVVRAYGC